MSIIEEKEKPKFLGVSAKLGKRTIEKGEYDPLLKAEAIKMAKWNHHDMILGATTVLGRELTAEETSACKRALFENKYAYLLEKEECTDVY